MSTWLENDRGAAFLLAIYFSALALLLLNATGLQRSLTETRAASQFAGRQQAFWLAEAGLETAVQQLHAGASLGGLTQPLTFPNGQAQLSATLVSSEIVSPSLQRLTYAVTSTGTATASARQAQVSATLVQEGAIRGGWAQGPIKIVDFSPSASTVTGDLRSGLGVIDSIYLLGEIHQDGALQIAPSGTTLSAYDSGVLFSAAFGIPWTEQQGVLPSYGYPVESPFGVTLQAMNCGPGCKNPATATPPNAAPLKLQGVAVPPYPPASCAGHLTLTTPNQQRIISDGDPLDLSPAGDGRIALCLQYIFASKMGQAGADPQIIFTAPTTVYLTGADPLLGAALLVSDFYAVQPGSPVTTAPLIPDGIQVVVPGAPGSAGPTASEVDIGSSRFSGSIFAPASRVNFTPIATNNPTDPIIHLNQAVAYEMDLGAMPFFQLDMSGTHRPAGATGTTVHIKDWQAVNEN